MSLLLGAVQSPTPGLGLGLGAAGAALAGVSQQLRSELEIQVCLQLGGPGRLAEQQRRDLCARAGVCVTPGLRGDGPHTSGAEEAL